MNQETEKKSLPAFLYFCFPKTSVEVFLPFVIHSTTSSALFWNTRFTSSGRMVTSLVCISTNLFVVAYHKIKLKKAFYKNLYSGKPRG